MIFKGICPNCGGPISELRLRLGLPCRKCLSDNSIGDIKDFNDLKEVLLRTGKAKKLIDLFLVRDELNDFEDFFRKYQGKELWSIQRAWAKRMLSNESFALIAPTGVGKTTLLETYAVYRAAKGSNVLYIVPTRELMKQVYNSLLNIRKNLNVVVLSSDEFKKAIEDLSKVSNFILVTTHAFIHRNKELISNYRFDVVIVDDFDALMKSSGVLNVILKVLGICDEAIKLATKVVNLKHEALFYKVIGNEDKLKEIQDELYEAELNLAKVLNYSDVGQLLIASATGRAKGQRAKILRELLGFEIGSILDYMRNLIEVAEPRDRVSVIDLIKRLYGGTLVFVSKDLGIKYAKEITEEFKKAGIRAEIARSRKALDLLRNGHVDVLVGIATYYGILTRGIDEPLRIYNTIFIGVPKFEVPLENILENPIGLIRVVNQLQKYGYVISDSTKELINRLSRLSPTKLRVLSLGIKRKIELVPPLSELADKVTKLINDVKQFISEKVRELGKIVFDTFIVIRKSKGLYAQIPDVMTYIQASGRCSRLLKGRMTLGLSILLYEDEDLFNIFVNKLRTYVVSYDPKSLNDLDLSTVIKEQIRSRTVGDGDYSTTSKIKSVLMIVESPTKARTIARMFGRPGRRYLGDYVAYETVITVNDEILITTIAPTMGHIYDLVVNDGLYGVIIKNDGASVVPVYTTIKRCRDCGYQFTDESKVCPRCGSMRIRDSSIVVNALRKLAQEVDLVILATDPDEEGERISYDVYLTLRPYINKFIRIDFHEITRREILNALMNPRQIDMNRVDSQIVRRVDDRLIGFEISNILKKRFGKYWLGGGRVQTPVLKWIVDRYEKYVRERGYFVRLKLSNGVIATYFTKDKDLAKSIIEKAASEGAYILKVSEEVRTVNPKPPFTTDTLLSEASRVLKISPKKIMKLAQDLFELGFITYHRTDSTHVSNVGIEIAKEYLGSVGLSKEFYPRSWGGKGTHECIRPTKALDSLDKIGSLILQANLTWYHKRLYELIFKRFIASQMKPAKVKYSVISIKVGNYEIAKMEIPTEIIDEGFTKVYGMRVIESLSKLSIGDQINIKVVDAKLLRGSKVSLYTSSDIIRLMKNEGIGRPSTYAKAIENNLRHGYVIESKKRLYLIPTKLGISVKEFIECRYPDLVSTEATRELEKLVDAVKYGLINRDNALLVVLADLARVKTKEILSNVEAVSSEVINGLDTTSSSLT